MRTARKSELNGFGAMLITLLAVVTTARGDDPDNCLLCHQFRGLGRLDPTTSSLHLYFVDPEYSHSSRGPHARLACTDCHEASEVTVIPHQPITPVNCARQCHVGSPTTREREFNHSNIHEMLEQSVHAKGALAKLKFSKGPLLSEKQSACLYCHDEPVFRDPVGAVPRYQGLSGRVFDRCNVCHAEKVPADIEYFVRHIASRLQATRPPMEMAQLCAVCHSDSAVLEATGMPDAVASFVRSFHGKAALLGDESSANCMSCHVAQGQNAHLMLGPKNPKSSVHATRIADSCRSTDCHPGAAQSIGATAVHLDLPSAHGSAEFLLAATFIVLTVLTFGPSAMLVLLELVQIIVGRSHHDHANLRHLTERLLKDPQGRERLKRFKVRHRVQHWFLTVVFILLVVTGFPMKFADRGWAAWTVQVFGGLQNARNVHHWAGVFLVGGFLVHMLDVFFVFLWRARALMTAGEKGGIKTAFVSLPMWISPADLRKTMQLLRYLVFRTNVRPAFGRFSPAEKFEYLGVFWGTVLLGVTGALLWGEQFASHIFGGKVFNLATIAHTYEAFLAVIHVGILHIYNVILAPKVFPLSLATITGHTPVDKLIEEHSDLVEDVAEDLGYQQRDGRHAQAWGE